VLLVGLTLIYLSMMHGHSNIKFINKFMVRGVNKLTCSDCGKVYVGQIVIISQKGKKNICVPSAVTVTHPNLPKI